MWISHIIEVLVNEAAFNPSEVLVKNPRLGLLVIQACYLDGKRGKHCETIQKGKTMYVKTFRLFTACRCHNLLAAGISYFEDQTEDEDCGR